ncbi:hypothetical protein ABWK22_01720 [Gottfriedia acidiceleris]
MESEDIMLSLKTQMKIHIEMLLKQGVRKQNIEIDVLHYLKKVVYADNH